MHKIWMIQICYITVPCSRGETVSDEPYEPRDDDDQSVHTHLHATTSASDNQVTFSVC